jgi:phenylacetate-CoA ligase
MRLGALEGNGTDPQGHRQSIYQLEAARKFLQTYPAFVFNLEEYLISRRCASHLSRRMRRFLAPDEMPNRTWPCLDNIVNFIRSNECGQIPAYRSYSAIEKFEDLPLISKSQLRAKPMNFLAEVRNTEPIWKGFTTGSSGSPVPFWYSTAFYFEHLLLAPQKILRRAGLQSDRDRTVFCIIVNDADTLSNSLFLDPMGAVGFTIHLVLDQRHPNAADDILNYIENLHPVCVLAKPSIFALLAERLEKANRKLLNSPDAIISSGSLLNEDFRCRLQERFTSTVINAYAMSEFGLIASECPGGGFHVDESSLYVEIVRGQMKLPWGRSGEVVVSSIDNRAMPLLRYRTGDVGTLVCDECPCGRTTPRLIDFLGRATVCFRLQSGKLYSPTFFDDLSWRFPVLHEFQMTQESADRYLILIELRNATGDLSAVQSALKNYVRAALPDAPEVTVRTTRFTSDSKFQRYRTNC